MTSKWFLIPLCFFLASCGGNNSSDDSLGDLESYDKAALVKLVEAGKQAKAVKVIRAREQLQMAGVDDFLVLADIYIAALNGAGAQVAVEKARSVGGLRSFTATKMASSYLLQGRLKDAKEELQIVAMTGPDALDALLMQGQIAFAEHKPDDARRFYGFAAEIAPDSFRVNTALALLEFNERNLEKARAEAKEALSKNPDTPIPDFVLGNVSRLEGEIDDSVEHFEKSLEIDDEYTYSKIELIGAYLDAGRNKDAQELLDKVALIAPNNSMVKFYIAYFQAEKGDWAGAEETLLRAGNLLRTNPSAAKLYGMVEYSLKKYGYAADYLQIYLKSRPNDRMIRIMAADSLRHVGFPEMALALLSPLLQEGEKDGSGFAQAGVVANAIGKPAEAQKYFEEAAKKLPEALKENEPDRYEKLLANLKFNEALADYEAGNIDEAFAKMAALPKGVIPLEIQYEAVARMELEQGDYDGAIQTAAQLRDIMPDSALASNIEGVAALRAGDPAKAVEAFNRVIKLNADYTSAFKNRASANMQLGQFNNALEDLEFLTQRYENNAELLDMLGRTYLELGQHSNARRALEQAHKQAPNSVTITADYGEALAREGAYKEAIKQAESALKLAIASPVLKENKELMKMLNANIAEYKLALTKEQGL